MPNKKYTIQTFGKGAMHYISLDAATIKEFAGKEKRLLLKIGDIKLHCALLHKKDTGYYITIGKTTLAKLKLKVGSIIEASFEKDTTVLQFEECEVLNEVLVTDVTAKKIWDNLTDGNKRSIIYWIQSIKNIDKQIERALQTTEKLKLGLKSIRDIMKK